jgi:hypothetical protein
MTLDGTSGLTTPGVVNTAGETIATTLVVTGVTTLTGGLNAALPVLSGGTGVTTKTGTGAVVLGTSPTLATPTFNSAQLATVSGTAPLYMCRAWVNFNGTGTVAIRASGNVSSITDLGVGNYRVNFTTAMSDANYSATIGWRVFSSVNIRSGGFDNYTTGYIEVYGGYMPGGGSFTAEDTTFISVAIFR